jgi:S-adenosylmethionine synthetase
MFGYACRETPTYMPAPLFYAHKILRLISEDRHKGKLPLLGPDSKSQVTLEYVNGKPVRASSIVVSTQHDEKIDQEEVRALVRPYVTAALPENWMCGDEHFYVNPTGRFVIGGPDGDAGLTGRKIIVDTYGGAAPHGGGAFSGKDPTKVDRSAAYMARYLAKNAVAAGIADRLTIQLAYAIGVSEPLAVYVNTHDTHHVDDSKLPDILREMVKLSPRGIRERLQLNKPIYKKTAAFGHFGREPEADGHFSWEKLDLVPELKRAYGLK